jgi:hypothetical protein
VQAREKRVSTIEEIAGGRARVEPSKKSARENRETNSATTRNPASAERAGREKYDLLKVNYRIKNGELA